MTNDPIASKIEQAEFHLDKLRNPESELAAESHFAALVTCTRSVAMYAVTWQQANCGVSEHDAWSKINAWELTLDADAYCAWRALVAIRNSDVHGEPTVPYRVRVGGYFGNYFGPDFFADHFGGHVVREVVNPKTSDRLDAVMIAERSLDVAKQLHGIYRSL